MHHQYSIYLIDKLAKALARALAFKSFNLECCHSILP